MNYVLCGNLTIKHIYRNCYFFLRKVVEICTLASQRDSALVQSVPTYSPKKLIQTIKSITAREVFEKCPQIKKKLWGGQFWTDGYYVATVSVHGNKDVIGKYVRGQGEEKEYKKLYEKSEGGRQYSLFDYM